MSEQVIPKWSKRPTCAGVWLCCDGVGDFTKNAEVVNLSSDEIAVGAPFRTAGVYGPIPQPDREVTRQDVLDVLKSLHAKHGHEAVFSTETIASALLCQPERLFSRDDSGVLHEMKQDGVVHGDGIDWSLSGEWEWRMA